MNLSRQLPILMLLVTLSAMASAQVQQTTEVISDKSANKDSAQTVSFAPQVDEVALQNRSHRSATANLFASASNPFGNKPKTIDSTTATKKPQAVDPDKWQFQLTPYIWIAGITGRAGIGGLIVDVDAGITDDNVDLNFGFMGTLEARKNRLVILTDLQYSNLGTDRATPRSLLFSSASADFKTFVFDPEVGYRVLDNPEKGAFVDVLGGIRYWHLRTDLTFNAGLLSAVTATRSRGWVDAVGGIRAKAHISKRVFLTGKADLGGGGSKFTYQLFGGAGILVGSKYALILGYRDLSVNYNKDGLLFDTSLQGPILGFGIKF